MVDKSFLLPVKMCVCHDNDVTKRLVDPKSSHYPNTVTFQSHYWIIKVTAVFSRIFLVLEAKQICGNT